MDFCGDCQYIDKYNKEYGKEKYMCTLHNEYRSERDVSCSDYRPNCFITTVVCNVLGYKDDCDILKALRKYRDGYLKQRPDGIRLLQEYDQIGPILSMIIAQLPVVYSIYLAHEYIIPTYDAIMNKQYDTAEAIYSNMVNMLKEKYNAYLIGIKVDYNAPYDINTLGKSRQRKLVY